MDEIPVDGRHSNYVFRIADTGVGMSQEFISHLFEPFSREHTDAGTKYQGTGLGMAITKELLDPITVYYVDSWLVSPTCFESTVLMGIGGRRLCSNLKCVLKGSAWKCEVADFGV